MAGPRPEKVAVVEEVREHLSNSGAAILTEYRGLKVGDLAALRRQLRTAGADYKIFKNTLVKRATAGTDSAVLDPYLEGPTAIAFVRDDVGAVAKVLRDFSRVHPELIVKGGLLGTKLVDAQGAGALADLPSREHLLAQIAGALAAPMRQFAGLLQAVPRSFAYGLSALIDKRGGVVIAEEAAETAEPAASAEAEIAEPVAAETAEPAAPEATDAAPETTEVAPGTTDTGAADAAEPVDAPEVSASEEEAAPAADALAADASDSAEQAVADGAEAPEAAEPTEG